MKRIIVILMIGLTLTGCGNADGVEKSLDRTKEECMQTCEYDGRVYIERSFLEDKETNEEVNKSLYKIVNSQIAIMKLMEGYSVIDTVFINPEVKNRIVEYYDDMLDGYDEIRYGVTGTEKYSCLSGHTFDENWYVENVGINFNSRKSKEDFYGRIFNMNKEMVALIEDF